MLLNKFLLSLQPSTGAAEVFTPNALFMWGDSSSGQLGFNNTTNLNSPVVLDTSSWTQISVGEFHTLAISSANTLFAWGRNTEGQLGDGTTVPKSSPVQIGAGSWRNICAGQFASTGVLANGLMFTWGLNSTGQLGDGTTVNKSSPVQIGSSSWTVVSTGASHTLAIRSDSKLFGWGLGALIDGGSTVTANQSSPVQIGTANWSRISAGYSHNLAIDSANQLYTWGLSGTPGTFWRSVASNFETTMAVRSDGLLFGWGRNNSGQLGDQTTEDRSSPVQIGTSTWTAVAVAAGLAPSTNTTYAIRSDGTLWAWGSALGGLLGNGITGGIDNELFSWTIVKAAANSSYAIRNDGSIFAWGNNTVNQLGVGPITGGGGLYVSRSSPVTVTSSRTFGSFVSLTAGGVAHALAIHSNGALYAWGFNSLGQLGDGTTVIKSTPLKIGASSWTLIDTFAGTTSASPQTIPFTLGTYSNGALHAWGYNAFGQLGDGTTINKSSPVAVLGGLSFSMIASGLTTSAGILSNGALYVWGATDQGFLGNDNLFPLSQSSPVKVGNSSWSQVGLGASHIVAIRDNGTMWAWGNNRVGQFGTNSLTQPPTTIYSWTTVASSNTAHTLAIRSDQSLWAWGNNSTGQLGNGTTIARSSPVQIGVSNWNTVATGNGFTTAIVSNGALFAWGLNNAGQLGDGTTVNKSSPVQIGTDSWSKVASGGDLTLALNSTSYMFGWGNNRFGQLGDGTTVNRSSPVIIASANTWNNVAVGISTVAAIRNDGALFTWGGNINGQMGDGTTINKSSPVQIGSESWSTVTVGDSHMVGIIANSALYAWGGAASGQIGDGTTIGRSSPVKIGASSWSTVAAGSWHTIGTDTNKNLYAWGAAASGQLGQGLTITRSSPVLIGSNFNNVFCGSISSFGINANSRLFAWGGNASGQLGTGFFADFTVNRSSPVQVPSQFATMAFSPVQIPGSWSKLSVGHDYTLALSNTNLLYGWGDNANNSLGLNAATFYRLSPPTILSPTANLKAGGYIDSSNRLFTWGYNFYGQLGDGTTFNKSSPVQVGTSTWRLIERGLTTMTTDAHSMFTLAVDSSNVLYAWGRNDFGQFGNGTTANSTTPTVAITGKSWASLGVGERIGAGITSNGELWTWGGNSFGQLGDGTTINKSSPVKIGSESWTIVTMGSSGVGAESVAAIHANGSLFAWGYNNNNNLGDGTTINRSSPVKIGSDSWLTLSSGAGYFAGIVANGALYTFGRNDLGQLGDGTKTARVAPTKIGALSWLTVSTGSAHALGLTSNGALYAWGLGTSGEFGDGTTISKSSPVKIGSNSWTFVKGGVTVSYAVDTSGFIYSWGSNAAGEMNDGTTINRSSPVIMNSGTNIFYPAQIGASSWTNIGAGPFHSMGILANGRLFTWGGNNGVGALGDGSTVSKSSPVQLLANTNFVFSPIQISSLSWSRIAATSHALGLLSNGALYAWGLNSGGQLGDGTTINKSSPVAVLSGISFSIIDAGVSASIGIAANGALYGWGRNEWGQIGDGTTIPRSSPIKIGALSWTTVAAPGFNTLGIVANSALYAWGYAGAGELGDGTTINKSSPVKIGASSWSVVGGRVDTTATLNLNYGITSDRRLFAWGTAVRGGLGNGLTTPALSTPSQIGAQLYWNNIHGYGCASLANGQLFFWGDNTFGRYGDNS